MASLKFDPNTYGIILEAKIKDLPPEAPADGLLGLSFLKYFRLTIDFKKGILNLE